MARRRSSKGHLQIWIDENVSQALIGVEKSFRGREVQDALHAGAEIIAEAVRRAAPSDTGVLRDSVYVASALSDGYRPLFRKRGRGGLVTKPLNKPPKPLQSLVKASATYSKNVQRGRWRKLKKEFAKPPNPYFRRGVVNGRRRANTLVSRRVEAAMKKGWESGGD